jgi:hypothetical protein
MQWKYLRVLPVWLNNHIINTCSHIICIGSNNYDQRVAFVRAIEHFNQTPRFSFNYYNFNIQSHTHLRKVHISERHLCNFIVQLFNIIDCYPFDVHSLTLQIKLNYIGRLALIWSLGLNSPPHDATYLTSIPAIFKFSTNVAMTMMISGRMSSHNVKIGERYCSDALFYSNTRKWCKNVVICTMYVCMVDVLNDNLISYCTFCSIFKFVLWIKLLMMIRNK